jgi:hypothetical protein
MNKQANEVNRTFLKEEVQMVKKKKHMKNFSPFLAIKEMQIKITLQFWLTLVRIVTIRTQTTTNVGEDARKRNPHTLLVGM